MSTAAAGEGRNWWNVRWSRSGAFHNERRHLVILSVLAGLVFFGAGKLGGSTGTSAPQQATGAGSFSASAQANAAPAGAAGQTGLAATIAADVGYPSEDLKVRMYNAYTKDNPIELYPWEHVAEPYAPTTMEMLDWPESNDNLEYR